MKKLLLLMVVGSMVLMLSSCSDSPKVVQPDVSGLTLVERPEFIEVRPPEMINQFIKMNAPVQAMEKKPPKPPPEPGDDPNPNPAHKYAYIVGIADYEGTVNDLQYPDDDAMAFKNYYQSQGFTCKVDLNSNATADDITAGLQWLIDNAAPGDEICFCYSGHGAKAPGYGSSIISHDLYYVTHGYVMSYFNAADCTKKLVTMDACVLANFHSDCEAGTMMATASTNCNSYDAPDLHMGAWSYFFIEAADDLGMPYAEDCATYAEDGMKAWAAQYRLRVCPDHTDKYDGMFDM